MEPRKNGIAFRETSVLLAGTAELRVGARHWTLALGDGRYMFGWTEGSFSSLDDLPPKALFVSSESLQELFWSYLRVPVRVHQSTPFAPEERDELGYLRWARAGAGVDIAAQLFVHLDQGRIDRPVASLFKLSLFDVVVRVEEPDFESGLPPAFARRLEYTARALRPLPPPTAAPAAPGVNFVQIDERCWVLEPELPFDLAGDRFEIALAQYLVIGGLYNARFGSYWLDCGLAFSCIDEIGRYFAGRTLGPQTNGAMPAGGTCELLPIPAAAPTASVPPGLTLRGTFGWPGLAPSTVQLHLPSLRTAGELGSFVRFALQFRRGQSREELVGSQKGCEPVDDGLRCPVDGLGAIKSVVFVLASDRLVQLRVRVAVMGDFAKLEQLEGALLPLLGGLEPFVEPGGAPFSVAAARPRLMASRPGLGSFVIFSGRFAQLGGKVASWWLRGEQMFSYELFWTYDR
jgi:hypothetical protein